MSNLVSRRSFIGGLVAAPAIITTPGILMPVRTFPWWGASGITVYKLRRAIAALRDNEMAVDWIEVDLPARTASRVGGIRRDAFGVHGYIGDRRVWTQHHPELHEEWLATALGNLVRS